MSLPRYPEYKEIGIEWLGLVPVHWENYRVKRLFDIGRGRVISQEEIKDDGFYPVFSSQTKDNGCLGFIDSYDFDCEQLTWTTDGANAGTVFLREGKHNCTNVCGTLQVKSKSNLLLRYGLYYLQYAAQFYKRPDTNGAKIMNGEMAEIFFIAPPYIEQTAIATFLDRETGKIDELIAEQEKLLTLLAEKRQATISHAVTKGLDPSAPMKDSGVEWLGEVPEHWEVKPAKFFSKIGNGSTPNRENAAYWSGGLFPWLNSSTVNQDLVTESEQFVTPLALKECHLPIIKPPAILIGITGQGRTRGMAATLGFEATINQHVAYVKPDNNRVNVDFLRSVFDMAYQHLRTESDWGGSTKGAITCDQIARLAIPLPNLDEQLQIVEFLNKESNKLDALTTEAIHSISLMKERRTALISAAVTGKIDVRSASVLAESAALA